MGEVKPNPRWNETVLQFIEREGPISTQSISSRFAMNVILMRRILNDLREKGLIESERDYFKYGTMDRWKRR